MRPAVAAAARDSRASSVALPGGVSLGGVVLAAAMPLLFLHVDYQPSVALPLGATFKASDAAVLAVALAAAAAAVRTGTEPLRRARAVWIAAGLFALWSVAACFYPLLSHRAYAWRTHLVTAAEFWEYALLAPSLPLLLRRRADAVLAGGTLVAWELAATGFGLAQWAGWSGLDGWGAGHRQPSFLGTHDFAALGGMTLLLGATALLWRVEGRGLRAGAWVAVGGGVVAFALGGATAGVVGLVPAAAVAVAVAARQQLLDRRAFAAALAATALASVGVLALRAGDFDQFSRFVGIKQANASTSANVQTYSQRTLLAYVGLRIWERHPLAGVGWQGSAEPSAFEPVLPAAHARFPDVAPIAFPSPRHRYGVQILYVQLLADLGIIGLMLFAALVAAVLAVGLRDALRVVPARALAPTLGSAWLVLALGFWTALGIVAGVPLDALTWIAVGLACAGVASGAAGPGAENRVEPGR